MPFLIGGTDVNTLAETAALNDPREATGFSNSNYRYYGYTHQDWFGTKMIMNYAGYIYSNEIGVNSRFLKAGSAFYSVAAKGCRPFTRKLWDTSTPNLYYVNRFSDGEVWVSTTPASRTGTRISTASQNIKYVFTMLIAPGGGGGGGNGTVSGGGGGGGSFLFLCHQLVDNWIYRLYVGEGGAAGARNSDGGNGGQCQAALFRDTNWAGSGVTSINIFGGSGAGGGNNSGNAGAGGNSASSPTSNSYIQIIDQYKGMDGGSKNNAGGSSPNTNTTAYNPENSRLNFGSGSGGTGASNGGGGGGSGWYFGVNHAGGNGGGGSAGGDGAIGAGGGGGAWMLFAGYTGGSGGNGYAALFY